jgi:enoyl-[acyl-carrier-protein] reductase (NADH)
VAPELTRSSILKGKKALIVGVANDRSIAWGCAWDAVLYEAVHDLDI